MPEPTKVRLTRALQEAGFPTLAARAANGEFDDYESNHAVPKIVLVRELYRMGDVLGGVHAAAAKQFADRVKAGEFDNTKEEAEVWFMRDGRRLLLGPTTPTEDDILAMRNLSAELRRLSVVVRRWLWHEVAADLELAAHSIERRASIGLPKGLT